MLEITCREVERLIDALLIAHVLKRIQPSCRFDGERPKGRGKGTLGEAERLSIAGVLDRFNWRPVGSHRSISGSACAQTSSPFGVRTVAVEVRTGVKKVPGVKRRGCGQLGLPKYPSALQMAHVVLTKGA